MNWELSKTRRNMFKFPDADSDKNYESEGINMDNIQYSIDLTRYTSEQLRDLLRQNVITSPELITELHSREEVIN